MRVLSYTLQNSEAASMRSPASVTQFMASSYAGRGSVTLADSEYPELTNSAFRLSDGEHLFLFAKDKPTMLRGLAQSPGAVQGPGANPPWGYLRGDYGSSLSLDVLKMSAMKQKAVVVGHELRSRGELRSALEREKLAHRGYFVLITSSNVLGDPRTMPKFTQLPMGSRSLRFATIASSLAHG